MGSMSSSGPNNSDAPYIQFVHVYKAFDEEPVLEDVSFEVRRGEMVVVLGKSGVGKSVTLKHILGFLNRTPDGFSSLSGKFQRCPRKSSLTSGAA